MTRKIVRTVRPILLASLGLFPGACQSPVARYIPKNTVRELQQKPNHAQTKQEEVAREICFRTKKESVTRQVFRNWAEGVGMSSVLSVFFPSTIWFELDISSTQIGTPSKFERRASELKVPSYTSGLVDNYETRAIRERNKKIDEEQNKKEKK